VNVASILMMIIGQAYNKDYIKWFDVIEHKFTKGVVDNILKAWYGPRQSYTLYEEIFLKKYDFW